MKQVAEMSLQHFSSSELYPPGPVIPAQRDAGFFAPAVLTSTTCLGIFDSGFSAWFTTCCRKIRGEILVYHETPPEGVSLSSPVERGFISANLGRSSWHRPCIVHCRAMNSVIGESVSISHCYEQRFKGPFQRSSTALLPQLAAHVRLLGTAAAGDKHGANKEVSHEGP